MMKVQGWGVSPPGEEVVGMSLFGLVFALWSALPPTLRIYPAILEVAANAHDRLTSPLGRVWLPGGQAGRDTVLTPARH